MNVNRFKEGIYKINDAYGTNLSFVGCSRINKGDLINIAVPEGCPYVVSFINEQLTNGESNASITECGRHKFLPEVGRICTTCKLNKQKECDGTQITYGYDPGYAEDTTTKLEKKAPLEKPEVDNIWPRMNADLKRCYAENRT